MSALADAKRSRSAARGWVTRVSNQLKELISKDKELIDINELKDALDNFNSRLSTLEEKQTAVEVCLPEDGLDADLDEAAEFLKLHRSVRVSACKCLHELNKDGDDSSTSSREATAKLPKLVINKFSGNPTEFQSFWDQFEAIVDSSDLPDVTKFTYLQSLLVGDAKSAITGLTLTSKNYKLACDLLKDRFLNKQLIIFTHIQNLMNGSLPA